MDKQAPLADPNGHRKHQTKKSIATRKAILDAAIRCFLEIGYHRTTTTEIAKRADVTRGAVQYYFPTTPDVLRASIDHMIDEWIHTYAVELNKMPQGAGRLTSGVDIYWELLQHPLFVAWSELQAAARTDAELDAIVDQAAKRYDRRRMEVGREIYAELKNVPDEVYENARDLLRVTLEGLANTRLGNNQKQRQDAIINLLKDMMDRLLGGMYSPTG